MQEIWKDIVGYEGQYQINNLGDIRSLSYKRSGTIKLLKPSLHKDGYSQIGLSGKWFFIHRLVAIAFIPNPLNLPCVCHRIETKINGKIYNGEDNLWWGTYSDNNKDRFKKGRANNNWQNNHPNQGKLGKDNCCSKKVYQYSLKGEFIKMWYSAMDVERELGVNAGNISTVCLGNRNSAGGFNWKFITE